MHLSWYWRNLLFTVTPNSSYAKHSVILEPIKILTLCWVFSSDNCMSAWEHFESYLRTKFWLLLQFSVTWQSSCNKKSQIFSKKIFDKCLHFRRYEDFLLKFQLFSLIILNFWHFLLTKKHNVDVSSPLAFTYFKSVV